MKNNKTIKWIAGAVATGIIIAILAILVDLDKTTSILDGKSYYYVNVILLIWIPFIAFVIIAFIFKHLSRAKKRERKNSIRVLTAIVGILLPLLMFIAEPLYIIANPIAFVGGKFLLKYIISVQLNSAMIMTLDMFMSGGVLLLLTLLAEKIGYKKVFLTYFILFLLALAQILGVLRMYS